MSESQEQDLIIDLRNPYLAALLAWLMPGLGHWYQGRRAKAILFAACIIPIFCIGAWLGSHRDLGLVRTVYFAWEPTGWNAPASVPRPYFLPQACIGIVAIPAILQSRHVEAGGAPMLNSLMAPPRDERAPHADRSNATLDDIIEKLQGAYELAILFTVFAGLLNLLAIFDAADGPIISRREKKPKDEDKKGNQQSRNL